MSAYVCPCASECGQLLSRLRSGEQAASVIIYNRPDTSTNHVSPGGFEEVRAFREGVMGGAEACLNYQG